jgi:hypothetical protein
MTSASDGVQADFPGLESMKSQMDGHAQFIQEVRKRLEAPIDPLVAQSFNVDKPDAKATKEWLDPTNGNRADIFAFAEHNGFTVAEQVAELLRVRQNTAAQAHDQIRRVNNDLSSAD